MSWDFTSQPGIIQHNLFSKSSDLKENNKQRNWDTKFQRVMHNNLIK